jgi:uncharacterized protein
MDTKQALETALHDAMRSKNETGLRTIRLVMSSIKMAEIDKGQPLDEPGVIAILQKEIKSRREAIADAEKAGRPDMVEQSKAEIAILEEYLPRQMPEEELLGLVKTAIQETQAKGPNDMGKVMKAVMPKVQGRVAGDVLSQMVRTQLAG